ncbi:MAG: hypothetical protein COT71_04570 [Candidatus Andersenbacteria bacterium CG10_big_fil_rev_8_21_14_0_10_54_11]|uniref:Uncharacterized protein n=1 Tax=Candidatus Andersenbacteria bacterium CG10_big_fil_rev_8_21_14_0_10_54_11 TaxID=1974485 RepID=A0A2M6WY87_9BACT|nr:MAG: hypothetical protein COT71_04570 [Candidatus Andersenbacteria bacterium CG10_big_fil_rev_8_21_14_0_10_54_11]
MHSTWIHLAGNPAGVKKGNPPFWRYRLGPRGEAHYCDSWEVTGEFDSRNNSQGTEIGADFLLWFAMFGTVVEASDPGADRREAHIQLAVPPDSLPADTEPGIKNGTVQTVRIYGAPDLVRQQQPLCWRCQIGEQVIAVKSICLLGNANATNFFPGSNFRSTKPFQRLWLTVRGSVCIDENQKATFFLN